MMYMNEEAIVKPFLHMVTKFLIKKKRIVRITE